MEINKIYSKKSFWIIIVMSVFIAAGISVGLFWIIDQFLMYFTLDLNQSVVSKHYLWLVQQFQWASEHYYKIVLPISFGVIVVLGLGVWLSLKIALSNTFKQIQTNKGQDHESGKKKKDFIDQKIEQDRKRRLFLHTLSVFQREGRLLDFFNEDLNDYDDEQIGAAVRSIQEDCQKVVKKYINPKPVINSEEGENVTIEKDFDIDAIKLVGNVSGEPPFEGVLNHRGWKAGKKEIPKLSDIQDSTIIIPAEVEIR